MLSDRNVGINNSILNSILYLQNNLHKIKIGQITQMKDTTAMVDFKITLNKYEVSVKYEPIECFILQNKNINYFYKEGDFVYVFFTDDNEELLINNNQQKIIDYHQGAIKHSLSNGIIIGVLQPDGDNNNILFFCTQGIFFNNTLLMHT